jgi:hypothetical protein
MVIKKIFRFCLSNEKKYIPLQPNIEINRCIIKKLFIMKKTLLFVMAAIVSVAINAQTIFSEGFDNVATDPETYMGAIPEGWTTYGDDLVNYYQGFSQSWDVYNFSDIGKVAISISWTEPQGNMCDRWLVTPAIVVPDSGYCLNFKTVGYDPNFPEVLEVKASTAGVAKEDFTASLLSIPSVPSGFSEYMINMDAYIGDTVYVAFINKGDGYYLMLDDIKVLVPVQNEIVLNELSIPAYARVSTDFSVKGTIINKGIAPLTSFDVTYSIDGGENVATYTVTGLNIPYNGTYEFTHDVVANIATTGGHEIEVTVSNPNGVVDSVNDNVLSSTISIYDNATQRKVFFEQFTTAKCPNCPPAHEYLDQFVPSFNNVVWMSHHAGYYTDALTIDESVEMEAMFNDGGATYAPAAMLDRTQYPGNPGPAMSVGEVTPESLQAAAEVPAFVTVDITNVTFNSETREISATVSGTVVSDISAYNDPRVGFYIKEDNVKINQAQSGSNLGRNYVHNHSIRASLSDVWGDAGVITNAATNGTFTKTYTYTVPETVKATDLYMIAFVAEYNADVNARTILNTNEVKLTDVVEIDPTSIEEATDVAFSVYPNPATDYAMISSNATIKEIAIINTVGQTVATFTANAENVQINTQDLVKGVYMVSITTTEGSAVKKLTVVK